MRIPVVWIETLAKPDQYTPAQLKHATAIASWMNRGKLVLAVLPEGDRE